jgi:hypothetical protein
VFAPSLVRCASGFFAAGIMLAGCGELQPPVVAAGTMQQSQTIATTPAHILAIGEEGLSHGFIAVYRAPFHRSPQILPVDGIIGMAIAPDGALIAASAYTSYGSSGIWVFDPPFKRKRLLKHASTNGQFLFDSRQRLIVPEQSGQIYVFKPPYRDSPVLTFGVHGLIQEVAIDSKDNVFVATERTGQGAPIYQCKPPSYYPCTKLPIGSGAVTVDSSDDLLTGVSSDRIGVFPPPYKRAKSKVAVPFPFFGLSAVNSGRSFAVVGGYGPNSYFGIFPDGIEGRFVRVPIEQYHVPISEYSIARNRDLFVSEAKEPNTYVSIYAYPYSGKPRERIRAKYQIFSLVAQ